MASEEELRGLAEQFHMAALGGPWEDALRGLAELTGSASGQLIGVAAGAAVPFNYITDLDPAALDEWIAIDGANPARNARVRAGLAAPVLAVLGETDFATEADLKGEVYRLYRRHGIEHSCQATLARGESSVVGLAVLRGGAAGALGEEEKRVFAALAPHVLAAVRLQIAVENQGAALLAGAMGALNLAAFVCDAAGAVRAMSPAAEELVRDGSQLAVRGQRLTALHPQDDRRLSQALADIGATWRPHSHGRRVTVRSSRGGAPVHLEVAPLPHRDSAFQFRATTLVVARLPRESAGRLPQVQALYGLSRAEAEVALALAAGRTLTDIAEERGVAIGTLRSQLKSIFGKTGVRRQAELAARLNET